MNGLYLSTLPFSAKVFCTLFLVGIGCGAIAAAVQAATAVGLTPAEVEASLAPEMPMTHLGHGHGSSEREIDLSEISTASKVWIRTPLLIQTSHTHLFGQTLIAGLCGLIFLFASLGDRTKALVIALPFIGTLLDIGGMWLSRCVWTPFSVLVIAGGSLFGLGYLLITLISFHQLWLKKEARA
ncbi:MAG: hypothetical protein ACREJG_01485 [Candidatus Rokuibacteriota bacterium]